MSPRPGILHLAAVVLAALMILGPPDAGAQRNFDKVMIEAVPAGRDVYMLTGAGGNLGVCTGADGVLLVDDQFGPLADKIRAAIARLSDQPIRFVVNTHWHGDHTGGNEALASGGAVILAHENLRRRMAAGQVTKAFNDTIPPAPAAALPGLTFTDQVTFHLNGQDIEVRHVGPAHTDGDAIVWFRGGNVVHMGDLYFNGLYPFIDAGSGGGVTGLIATLDRILPTLDPATKLIPGHGPLSNAAELTVYRGMLATIAGRVGKAIAEGKSREQCIADKPSADFDERWAKGSLKPEVFVGLMYDDLSRK